MIDVYYWPSTNGRKIPIMLEEVGLEYNIIPTDFTRGDTQTAEYRRINPIEKIPAIVDHDALGGGRITLFESAVILQYLAEKSGKLLPTEVQSRYTTLKWLLLSVTSLGPMIGQLAHFDEYAREKIPYAINRYAAEVERLYRVFDARLAECEYLGGAEFSIADISAWTRFMPERQRQDWKRWPNLKRWHDTVGSRPAVKRGNAVRIDLRDGPGAARLDDHQFEVLYGWQQRGQR
jgi:GST-like protein